ncbi:MAG: O-methyltransferase [Bacteroidota bacterium]
MDETTWTRVEAYFNASLLGEDPVLEAALQASVEAGLPAIHVAPSQGKLLHLLVRVRGARRVLEIGTLGGYSTIWMARALPSDGHLLTVEHNAHHAAVARENLDRAGLAEVVEVRLGPALDTLDALLAAEVKPFDFVFIDADKERIPAYVERSLRLSRPGTVLIVDNVVRRGAVADPGSEDARVHGVQRMVAQLAARSGVSATAVQTVGEKGYDGFVLMVVEA